ncbi:MAG: BON domain-containing protein [Pirellulaceae bacterium]|nr:BON domain-containing protein [Pirellulaceae bacterium]
MTESGSICDRIDASMQRLLNASRHHIICENDGGNVTLRGRVESKSDRTLCFIITRSVPGVRSVKNLLQVGADRRE